MGKWRGNFFMGNCGKRWSEGRKKKIHHYSHLPQARPQIWRFSDCSGWGLSSSTAGKGRDTEAESSLGVVPGLTHDVTTRDPAPLRSAMCGGHPAGDTLQQRRRWSQNISISAPWQTHNPVTNSQPQQGTQFGKQRQVPTNLVLGRQQTAQTG